MKKITCLFLILSFILVVPGVLLAVDLEEGFPGINWGAEMTGDQDFEKIRSEQQIDFYRTPNKIYLIFDFGVPDVIFGFYENKFFAAYIRIESLDVFARLKSHLTEKYGEPESTLSMKTEQTTFKWKKDKIKIKLKVWEKEGRMKMGIYYTPISEKIEESKQEEFIERTPRFFPTEKDKVPDRVPLFKF